MTNIVTLVVVVFILILRFLIKLRFALNMPLSNIKPVCLKLTFLHAKQSSSAYMILHMIGIYLYVVKNKSKKCCDVYTCTANAFGYNVLAVNSHDLAANKSPLEIEFLDCSTSQSALQLVAWCSFSSGPFIFASTTAFLSAFIS